jgi:hypothetical protein
MDGTLRDRALSAIGPPPDTHNGDAGMILPQGIAGATFLDPEAGEGGE